MPSGKPAKEFKCNLSSIRPGGWMKQQMQDDLRGGFAGCLDKLTSHAASNIFTTGRVRSFETTPAGMIEDTARTWWDGETRAVWLDGLTRMAYLSGEKDYMAKVDGMMAELLESQDEDGYIGIYHQTNRYRHPKENGELWTQSRVFVAMLAYYELSGKEEYLQAVKWAVALTMKEYGPHRSYFRNEEPAGGTGHGLMFVDVCAWLYRLTGEEIYRDYGKWCYEDYSSSEKIRDKDMQIQNLLNLSGGLHFHTPHAMEHLRVPVWLSSVCDDDRLRQAACNALEKMRRYLVPSGAPIGDEWIKDRPPTADMLYEYCAITELLVSLQQAWQLSGEAVWGDLAEWLVFNAAQGARLPDGTAISYLTRDNRFETKVDVHSGKLILSPTHEQAAVCCNPNSVKLLPYYTSGLWTVSDDSKTLTAFCYGPSEASFNLNGKPVKVRQKTNYPFEESVTFIIDLEKEAAFDIRLRIPGWAVDYELQAGDAEIYESDSFCTLSKTWQDGDRIVISLNCAAEQLMAADGWRTVKRGPLLYALPVREQVKVEKKYDYREFKDLSLKVGEFFPYYRLDPDAAFRMVKNPGADLKRPYWNAPVKLEGEFIDPDGHPAPAVLEPIGCTVLRQTAFPSTVSKVVKGMQKCQNHL